MRIVGKSDIGLVRNSNQDSFTVKNPEQNTFFAVLCDGMGGHAGGKVAGQLACFAAADYIEEYCSDFGIPENAEPMLKEAVAKANGVVFSQSLKNRQYRAFARRYNFNMQRRSFFLCFGREHRRNAFSLRHDRRVLRSAYRTCERGRRKRQRHGGPLRKRRLRRLVWINFWERFLTTDIRLNR